MAYIINRLKNLSAAVNATRSSTRIWYEGGDLNQKQIFLKLKLSNLGHVLNKPLQIKRITEGVWRQSPKPMGDFCDFMAKDSDF